MAKGFDYLALDRQSKAEILWTKIGENNLIGAATPPSEQLKVPVATAFDEYGDEFDCRLKTIHQQGNVGKA